MALDLIQRRLVEMTKESKSIGIVLNPNTKDAVKLSLISDRRFSHEIGLALQEYFIKKQKEAERCGQQ